MSAHKEIIVGAHFHLFGEDLFLMQAAYTRSSYNSDNKNMKLLIGAKDDFISESIRLMSSCQGAVKLLPVCCLTKALSLNAGQ